MENLEDASSEHPYEAETNLPEENLEELVGLIDPNKPKLEDDVVNAQDLMIARNLRRLEIHRYEIASALKNISDEEVGNFCVVEDEIEISESDEEYAKYVSRINNEARSRRKERLDPEQILDQRLEKIIAFLKQSLHKVTTRLDLKSWDYMRHNMFLAWHQHRYDREMEQRLFSPLAKFRNMSRAQTLREREAVVPCAPVRLVNWSLDCIASYQEGGSFRHFIFMDPVAGHGRTLLMASHRDFRAIYGIEPRGNFAEDAAMNIAQYPRTYMIQRQIELITRDFRLIEWPGFPLVIHIFNPQSANWLHEIMEKLSQSFEAAPRQIYIVIIGNNHKEVMDDFRAYQAFTPPSSNLEMISLMSPYDIDFYTSVML